MYPGGHDDYNDYEINCGQMTCDCTAEFEQRRRKKRQVEGVNKTLTYPTFLIFYLYFSMEKQSNIYKTRTFNKK